MHSKKSTFLEGTLLILGSAYVLKKVEKLKKVGPNGSPLIKKWAFLNRRKAMKKNFKKKEMKLTFCMHRPAYFPCSPLRIPSTYILL